MTPGLRSAELDHTALGAALGVPVKALWAEGRAPLSLTVTVPLVAPGLTRAWLEAAVARDLPGGEVSITGDRREAAPDPDAFTAGRHAALLQLAMEHQLSPVFDLFARLFEDLYRRSAALRAIADRDPRAGRSGWRDADPLGTLVRP